MNIYEIIGTKDEIITEAMKHPALTPKRNPTIEQAMKAVASQVEFAVMSTVGKQVEPVLQDMWDMYTLTNGEADDVAEDEADNYSSGLDDEVEKALAPWEPYLSANWLGEKTIDTRLWEKDAVSKLAASAAKEVFKQITYQKTPAQVLSNAGIVQADVEIYLEQHLAPKTAEQEKAMADATEQSAEDLAAKIKAHVGTDFDQMTVYDDLELAFDDDEILAGGAAARLGLDGDTDLNALQMIALEQGDESPQYMIDLINDAAEPKKGRSAKKADKPKSDAPKGSGIDPAVLELLKTHGGTKDTEMASGTGVSRATYNNWINGKTEFKPDEDQMTFVRDTLVGHINGLLEALAKLDGTEQMEVS